MIGWVKKTDQRRVWIMGAVTAGHVVLLAWALTLPMEPSDQTPQTVIEIDFADIRIADPRPEPEPPPEPVSVIEDEPAPRPVAQNPPPQPPQTTGRTPSVLTQNATAEAGGVPGSAAMEQAEVDSGETIDPQLVSTALRNLACQKLTMTRSESCPKLDPFDVAEASRARAEASPSDPLLVGDFGPKSMLESFMNQKDRAPFIMPGMSADLFTEGMAPGAYDAQRIRSGREPLWSQDMKDGFRRGE